MQLVTVGVAVDVLSVRWLDQVLLFVFPRERGAERRGAEGREEKAGNFVSI